MSEARTLRHMFGRMTCDHQHGRALVVQPHVEWPNVDTLWQRRPRNALSLLQLGQGPPEFGLQLGPDRMSGPDIRGGRE